MGSLRFSLQCFPLRVFTVQSLTARMKALQMFGLSGLTKIEAERGELYYYYLLFIIIIIIVIIITLCSVL